MREHSHDDNGMVVLQNCADLEKNVRGPCSETCPISSHDSNHVINIKVEEISGIEEEKVPVPVTCQAIKAEHEVSFISICPLLSRFHRYPESPIVFIISTCLSLCPHETNPLW
jgi:hypothetical protein